MWIFNWYRFFTRKALARKSCCNRNIEYSPLDKELKAQTSTAEKQYKKLDKVFEFNKKKEKDLKNCAKSDLVNNKDFLFYKYHTTKEFVKRSFNQYNLIEFKDTLELFYYDTEEIKPNNEDQEKDLEKRKVVFKFVTSKLYDKLLNRYKTQYNKNKLSEQDNKKKINVLKRPENVTLDFADDDLPPILALEDDEEVKWKPEKTIAERIKLKPQKTKITRIKLKILTPDNLLYRLPILLAQIKAENNSNKLKNIIRQMLHLVSA